MMAQLTLLGKYAASFATSMPWLIAPTISLIVASIAWSCSPHTICASAVAVDITLGEVWSCEIKVCGPTQANFGLSGHVHSNGRVTSHKCIWAEYLPFRWCSTPVAFFVTEW